MQYKVIVLDFDGVIVESNGIKDQAFEYIFAQHTEHFDAIMSYHLAHNATIRFEKFQYIYETILKLPYDQTIQDQLAKQFSDYCFEKICACPFVQGAEDFLNHFCTQVPLYIASINPEEEFRRILKARQIDHFFKDVYVVPWKKKDALQDIAQKEGIGFKDILFIGDSPEDHQAALDAEVSFIGRDSGKQLECDLVYSDFKEIQSFLESF